MNQTNEFVRTGFATLDNILGGGLRRGELTILGASEARGKTSLSLRIVSHVVLAAKQPVLIFSLKLSRHAVMERLIAYRVRLNPADIHSGHFDQKKWPALKRAATLYSKAPLYIVDRKKKNVSDVLKISARLSKAIRSFKMSLGLVIIDRLQLLRGAANVRYPNRQSEVDDTLRDLNSLASQFNIGVLLLSRLPGQPRSDTWSSSQITVGLNDSGITEDHFDNAILVHRGDADHSRKKARLFVSRRPIRGLRHCDVRFDPSTGLFCN